MAQHMTIHSKLVYVYSACSHSLQLILPSHFLPKSILNSIINHTLLSYVTLCCWPGIGPV